MENMTSISFDPIAHVYDTLRGYPESVGQQIAEAMDKAMQGTKQTRLFEIGVGTGRFALPLVSLGRQYTGIDISQKMLNQLEEKLRAANWQKESLPWGSLSDEDESRKLNVQRFVSPSKQATMRLVIADMTAIPFHDASFDAVIASHVFHLVSEWQQALKEVRRIVRPGGVLMRCWNEKWENRWGADVPSIRGQWSRIVQELGGSTRHPGTSEQEVTAWLQAQGMETEQQEVLVFQRTFTPHTLFDGIARRQWTSASVVPEPIFTTALERLRQWVNDHYDAATFEEPFTEEAHVIIGKTQM
jgi:ubiquinone/menaquinone biosynthesis C-methylase UbiE